MIKFTSRRELYNKLNKQDLEIRQLNNENQVLRTKLEAFDKSEIETPNDCTRGPWCQSCLYRKALHVPSRNIFCIPPTIVYFCDRGNICKNFVQIKWEELNNG